MTTLRHGPPLAMNGFMDKEGRKLRGRKTRYFKLRDSALFNHRRKDAPASWGVSLIDSRVAVGHKGEVIVQLFDGKKILVFPHSRADSDMWVDLLQRAAARKIGNFYGVTGLIGMGSFAEVRIGYDKSSGDQVAIKVMKKNKRDTELMRSVECEMNFISKNIDHENIVKTYDVFDTRDNLFIVMEYMPGGMLYDILATEGQFSEKDAASIMRDLLEAVHCLHSYDIVHRDIKPENVLAVSKSFPLRVKLADFGLADFVLENSFGEKSTCGMYGTPFFVAPEVIRAETYTPAVDIWSLGVLCYNMLSGTLPFDGSNIKDVLRKVRAGRYEFPDAQWAEISSGAKHFIKGLLELDPHARLTARQALNHTWLNSDTLSERAIANDRSALGYDQRKLRMSSMAIDDVAALLDMDDDDDVDGNGEGGATPGGGSGSNISALSRMFPGRISNAKPRSPATSSSAAGSRGHNAISRSSRHSTASRSSAASAAKPPLSVPVTRSSDRGRRQQQQQQQHQHQEQQQREPSPSFRDDGQSGDERRHNQSSRRTQQVQKESNSSAQSYNSQSTHLPPPRAGRQDSTGVQLRSSDDILPPLHPLAISGRIPNDANVDSLSPEDLDPFAESMAFAAYGARTDSNYSVSYRTDSGTDGEVIEDDYQQHTHQYHQRHRNGQTESASLGQEYDASGYRPSEHHVGGFEANPGFALPAIVSVKEIRKQREREAAAAAAAATAVAVARTEKPGRNTSVSVANNKPRVASYGSRYTVDEDSEEDDTRLFRFREP